MKTLLKLLLLLILASYLVYAFIHVSGKGDNTPCRMVQVTFTDSLHNGFITADEVYRLLKKANVYPVGLPMDSVDGKRIEDILQGNGFIKEAVCFKAPNGVVNLTITQRLPLLRIMPDGQPGYYIDAEGDRMEERDYHADLVVATGRIDSIYVKKQLVPMACYLRDNAFWNDMITQIHVRRDRKMDLYTRVGSNMVVHFGTTDSLERKFRNLRAFYEQALPKAGWDTYESINVEYYNQVVATRI